MYYNGFNAKIEFEDDTFVGTVLGVDDSLTFTGNTVDELKASFKQSIDNYIEICKKLDKDPHKQYSGTFNIRISSNVHRYLANEARTLGISLNAHISNILKNYSKHGAMHNRI